MRALAAAVALLVCQAAYAQAPLTPPPLPGEQVLVRDCFGNTSAQTRGTVIHGDFGGGVSTGSGPAVPSGSTSAVSSADAPLSGLGGGGGGEAVLVVLVAAAVALPVIVYAVDAPANEEILFQYGCPHFDFTFTGGAVSTPAQPSAWSPLVGGHFTFAAGALGLSGSIESTVDSRVYGAMDAHLLLRPPPREHIEGALALGFRRVVFGGAERNGFEVALPHRYVLTRVGHRPLGLSVTPGVFLGNRGLDYRLEAGLTLPLWYSELTLGGRVFSFDSHVRAGMYVGLGLYL